MTIAALCVVFSLLALSLGCSKQAETPKIKATPGVVASAHALASKAGAEMLEKGGNAVDAAVATAFALGVVEPYASGIGGGGFMLIFLSGNRTTVAIDFRETAPHTPVMDRGRVRAKQGPLAVAVPGTVAGLTLALSRYGSMDLKTILAPAIRLANQGFEVDSLLSGMMRKQRDKLRGCPAAAQIFLKQGDAYVKGDRLYQKDLAATLQFIAGNGAQGFYGGAIGKYLEAEMKKDGGVITREDLQRYRALVKTPVLGSYRGYEIVSMPPGSCGTHVVELMNIIEGYDIPLLGQNTALSLEKLAKAVTVTSKDRARFMGDPDFVRVPIKELTSKHYAAKQIDQREGRKRMRGQKSVCGAFSLESDQTSHISVVDGAGNLVSLTQSLNGFFGSGIVIPGTGILLNNQMADFAAGGKGPNRPEAGKRPASAMSPTIVLKDGTPHMALGSAGASRILSVLPQILINVIDFRMDLHAAINAPRLHAKGQLLSIESRIPNHVRKALAGRGFIIDTRGDFDIYFGGVQAVMRDPVTGQLSGAADPRRSGAVAVVKP